MEEKILLKSKRKNYWIAVGIVLLISVAFLFAAHICLVEQSHYVRDGIKDPTVFDFLGCCFSGCLFDSAYASMLLAVSIGIMVVALILIWWLSRVEMVITNKRVYGKVAFGKRVDLPLDSISAVGMGALGSVSVGTSSGKISFLIIKNNKELHACINDLLISRQQKPTENSDAENLRKYKSLLDEGLISQEEFDAKKKQLLNL
jgi:hypothetical protein